MGVTSVTLEAACPVNPERMFKALLLDGDNLLPKLMHQRIKSVEKIQGDGGAGTTKQVEFAEGGDIKYVKNQVDEIDKERLIYKYTLIEGDGLLERLESIGYEVRFETSGDGGYVCKMISNYYTVGDNKVEEEVIKAGKERALRMYKVVEAYLLANPDAYN